MTVLETLKEDETIFCIKKTHSHSLHVELELNNTLVPLKVDTGGCGHYNVSQFIPAVFSSGKVGQHRSGFTNLCMQSQ